MSDVSQGEGWWVASDGCWYEPQDHPNDAAGLPSQVPVPEVSGHSAEEPSTDRSAVALATARQCVNGHEMPESHVFCGVCGSQESEELSDFSVSGFETHIGLGHEIGAFYGGGGRRSPKARILLTAVIAVCVLGLGLGLGLGLTGGNSASSTTPTTAVTPETAYFEQLVSLSSDFENLSTSVGMAQGEGACEDIADGDSVTATLEDGDAAIAENPQWGLTVSDITDVIGAAVDNLCPQYRASVQAQLQAMGYS